MTVPTVSAMAVTIVGSAASMVATVLAQASPDPGALANYVQGAGSLSAVGGIVYIARLMATGRLVARDPGVAEKALEEVSKKLVEVIADSNTREDTLRTILLERARAQHRKNPL